MIYQKGAMKGFENMNFKKMNQFVGLTMSKFYEVKVWQNNHVLF